MAESTVLPNQKMDAMEQPAVKRVHEVSLNTDPLWSGGYEERLDVRTKLLEEIADDVEGTELGTALQVALKERQHVNPSVPQHVDVTVPEASRYLFRCLKANSSTQAISEIHEAVREFGSEDSRVEVSPMQFSVGMPLNNWFFPRPKELESGIDTSIMLVYTNNGLITPQEKHSVKLSPDESRKALVENHIGTIQINWK